MHPDELSAAVNGLYGKIDRIEQALAKLLEVEISQNYLRKEVDELKRTVNEQAKELEKWRFARYVLIALGVIATPIFVSGAQKILGWH